MNLDDAATRLEALGNPTRLRIYRALVRAGHGGLTVGKLQARLDVAPSTLSHHLKALLIVGLITQERQVTSLICRANYDAMHALVAFLVAECCSESERGAEAESGAGHLIPVTTNSEDEAKP